MCLVLDILGSTCIPICVGGCHSGRCSGDSPEGVEGLIAVIVCRSHIGNLGKWVESNGGGGGGVDFSPKGLWQPKTVCLPTMIVFEFPPRES